jgi:hypothetical protein
MERSAVDIANSKFGPVSAKGELKMGNGLATTGLTSDDQNLISTLGQHADFQASMQALAGGEQHFRLAAPPSNVSAVRELKRRGIGEAITKERLDRASQFARVRERLEIPAPPRPPLPFQLGPWTTGPIVFGNGVPVGGNASLALFQDGTYAFNGHFHDSGASSYNIEFAWLVVSGSGRAFTFSFTGHTAGTFQAGSRDADWNQQGKCDNIAAFWGELSSDWSYRWNAGANWDVQAVVDGLIKAAETVGTIISSVEKVVALVG